MMDRGAIVDSISGATKEVFSTMLGLEVRRGDTYVEQEATGVAEGVVALIGITGPWVGTGTICCRASLACKLSSRLLGTDPQPAGEDSINEEVLDAMGEIANMIVGNAKNALEERLGPMGMSIPTVIFGHNFVTRSIGNKDWVVVPFFCDGERMDVKVCLVPSAEHHPVRHGFNPPASLG